MPSRLHLKCTFNKKKYSSKRNDGKMKEEPEETRGKPQTSSCVLLPSLLLLTSGSGASWSVTPDLSFHISKISWLGLVRAGGPSRANKL